MRMKLGVPGAGCWGSQALVAAEAPRARCAGGPQSRALAATPAEIPGPFTPRLPSRAPPAAALPGFPATPGSRVLQEWRSRPGPGSLVCPSRLGALAPGAAGGRGVGSRAGVGPRGCSGLSSARLQTPGNGFRRRVRADRAPRRGRAGGRLLSNPRGREAAARAPTSPPRCSPAAAPPPRPALARRAPLGAGRAGLRARAGPQQPHRPRLGPAQSLARPWPVRSSSGRGDRTTGPRPRRRRPCRTRSWPWPASTCCSTTASGSRTSFSNNTGDPRALLPAPATRTSRSARALSSAAGAPSPPVGH